MKANFFGQIELLGLTGDLNITIKKGDGSNWVVSVLLQNNECGDSAKTIIPSLNLRGTSKELDEGFFGQMTAPLQSASGLMVNMEAFMKQLEEAKKQSAMEKEKSDREKKAKEERDKKYRDALAKAEKLETEGKYREAWTAMPKVVDHPEHAENIRKKLETYERQFAPSLFGEG
jgi:PRTRC genetic system protein E